MEAVFCHFLSMSCYASENPEFFAVVRPTFFSYPARHLIGWVQPTLKMVIILKIMFQFAGNGSMRYKLSVLQHTKEFTRNPQQLIFSTKSTLHLAFIPQRGDVGMAAKSYLLLL